MTEEEARKAALAAEVARLATDPDDQAARAELLAAMEVLTPDLLGTPHPS